MRFDPKIDTREIPQLIKTAIELGTLNAWEGRFRSIKDQLSADPFMERYLLQQYEVECAMYRMITYQRQTGRIGRIGSADTATHRLLGFAAALTRVHERLSSSGAKKLKSMVRGALTDKTQSLASVAFELAVITNLMHRKVDVICNDLEDGAGSGSGGTFDFLLRANGLEVEVECKTFNADIGRKIHRKRYYELSGRVRNALLNATESKGSFLIEVSLPSGMQDAADVRNIEECIVNALESGSDARGESHCSITLHRMLLEGSPFDSRGGLFVMPDEEKIIEFIRTKFGFDNTNISAVGKPNSGFAFLVVRSLKPDTVADYILGNLKDGSKQLSGRLPGIVCAHMLDMTGGELAALKKPSENPGMQTNFERIMREFFGEPSRSHVYAARFSAPGSINRKERLLEGNLESTFHESGVAFRLKNASHPLYDDTRMDTFL